MGKIYGILCWELKKIFERFFHFIYINIPIFLLKRTNIHGNKINSELDIYVIAFNNFDTIQLQYEKLNLHLDDKHNYIVIDNSNKKVTSKNIYDFCNKNRLIYISLPKQNVFKVSASHALALNWVSKNLIQKRKPSIVGLIDHDIFPFDSYSVVKTIGDKPFYGVRHFAISDQNRTIWDTNTPAYWYLWPGFMFFKFNSFDIGNLNFMPMVFDGNYFDTGGEMYKMQYFKFIRLNSSYFARHQWVQIEDKRGVDLFDNRWVHISNVSNWRGVDEKLDYSKLSEIINGFEIS